MAASSSSAGAATPWSTPTARRSARFGDVFPDRETQQPAWGGVRTGPFGRRESYVPLERIVAVDDELRVPFTKEVVKDAPKADPDVALTAGEKEALWRHYGQEYVHLRDDEPAGATSQGATTEGGGRLGDDAMTRSEEEVRIHEGPMRPVERVRLRKVMVTENQTRTVPVRKEVVQLETDAPPDGRVEEVVDVDEDPSARR